MDSYNSAVEHALDPEEYLRYLEDRKKRDAEHMVAMNQQANDIMAVLCGLQPEEKSCDECEHPVSLHRAPYGCEHEYGDVDGRARGQCGCAAVIAEDEFQALLEKYWNLLQKGIVAVLLLLVLVGTSRADSLTESQVASQLEQGIIPLAVGVGDELANNLLAAQLANISYTQFEPDSLQLSIDAVLKAISIYVWPGGPTLITNAQDEPVVWWQSETAIDTRASLSISPSSIDFGPTPISTPEPATLLLLLPLFGLVFMTRSASEHDVEVAINALEIEDEGEKQAIRSFYARERTQDREANKKLVKALLRVAGKVAILFLVSYAFWAVWTERLPK